jgi:Spy/CpxP family protein refolding chaperone
MKTTILTSVLALSLITGFVSQATARPNGPFAEGGSEGGPPKAMRPLREALQKISPTEEQRASIKQIIDGHRSEIAALTQNGQAARQLMADAATSAEKSAAAEKLAAVAQQRSLLFSSICNEILPLLTTEQRDKLKALREELKQRTPSF